MIVGGLAYYLFNRRQVTAATAAVSSASGVQAAAPAAPPVIAPSTGSLASEAEPTRNPGSPGVI